MSKIIEKNMCCGCSSCVSTCPIGAINMIEDEKGFKYPQIDDNKCIKCGACKNSCPILNNIEIENDIEAFACYNTNIEERTKSSSGGIFILLAKEIINKKGVVFGATFDDNFNVFHTYFEDKSNLQKFMGSKYTQSIIGDSYKKVKEFLEEDRYVLFTGTPCQIEGLRAFLKKDYSKLYTQDIVCHGVPSPKVWQKYLNYQENFFQEKITNISFRNKDNGWASFQMKIFFDSKIYSMDHHKDIFMKAFLSNICLRDSCYNCSFKKKNRISDITLADYWGIDDCLPGLNDNKGISLILLNTSKGKELFNNIKNDTIYKKTDFDQAIKKNLSMIKSVNHNKNEKEFIDNIDTMSFDVLIKKFIPNPSICKRLIRKIKTIIKK